MKVCGRYLEISAGHNSQFSPACKLAFVSVSILPFENEGKTR
jgi:hypothetical protein